MLKNTLLSDYQENLSQTLCEYSDKTCDECFDNFCSNNNRNCDYASLNSTHYYCPKTGTRIKNTEACGQECHSKYKYCRWTEKKCIGRGVECKVISVAIQNRHKKILK